MRKGFDAALALREGQVAVRFQALGLAQPACPGLFPCGWGAWGKRLSRFWP